MERVLTCRATVVNMRPWSTLRVKDAHSAGFMETLPVDVTLKVMEWPKIETSQSDRHIPEISLAELSSIRDAKNTYMPKINSAISALKLIQIPGKPKTLTVIF